MRDGKLKKLKDYDLFEDTSSQISKEDRPGFDDKLFPRAEIEGSVVERFRLIASRYPERKAIEFSGENISYIDLLKIVKSIAHSITEHGRAADSGVALLFEHGIDMVKGMLSALFSGNHYIPLDPNHPDDRIVSIVEDSKTGFILTNRKNMKKAWAVAEESHRVPFVLVIENCKETEGFEPEQIDPDSIAYILYTSGSTGKPKGVMQSRRNLLHFISTYTNRLGITADDRLSLLSSYGFDAAVMDIYGAILNGATLLPFDLKRDGSIEHMASWLKSGKITIYHSIPTLYRYLTDSFAENEKYEDIRLVVLGGEAVFREDVERFRKHFPEDALFINGLGPTESTVTLQYFVKNDTVFDGETVPVGFPVENTEVFILDESGNEAALNVTGEIVYKSDFLALGYTGDPEKTAASFTADPRDGTGRVYRSGDLGRRVADESIVFVGRKDFQVKIRGYRIELGEIEGAILSRKEVKSCAVAAMDLGRREKALVAYVETDSEFDEKTVKNHIGSLLPEYMVPEIFVKLDKMPLNSNGKVDRKKLPEPSIIPSSHTPPETDLQKKLVAVWSELLAEDENEIGIDDSFFAIGGHSLRAMALMARIVKDFDAEVHLIDFFRSPTIRSLAGLIEGGDHAAGPLEHTAKVDLYPLSPAQRRIYILSKMEPEETHYNLTRGYSLDGFVDIEMLETAFRKMIERHEILRTSFEERDGNVFQQIHSDVFFSLERFDAGESLIDEKIERFIQPFDLSEPPLIRAGLFRTREDHHVLVIDMHHTVTDGTSNRLFMKELLSIYSGNELDSGNFQYRDYVLWLEKKMKSESYRKVTGYWLERFKESPESASLPTDFKRPRSQRFEGKALHFNIPSSTAERISYLAKEREATTFMVLLAGFSILVSKISGSRDLVIGTPSAGRSHSDLSSVMGIFINTLAIRMRPEGGKSFAEYLEEVKKDVLDSFESQDYPFENLVEELKLERDPGRNPLFDLMFNFLNMDPYQLQAPGVLIEPHYMEHTRSRFDITLYGSEQEDGIGFTILYRSDLFKESTIRRFMNYYTNIIGRIVENAEGSIASFDPLGEEDRSFVLEKINSTGNSYPSDRTIHSLFTEIAGKKGDEIALICGRDEISYRELEERSNRLANLLINKGGGKGRVVGVLMERSVDLMVSLLAVLKTGAVYLPMDPHLPEERLRFMARDSKTFLVLTKINWRQVMEGTEISILDVDEIEVELAEFPVESPAVDFGTDDPAYIIYTSGSTGRPKGVLGLHHGAVNRFFWMWRRFPFAEDEVYVQRVSFSFVGSIWDLFGPLLGGAQCVMLDDETLKDPYRIVETIHKFGATRIVMVPSLLKTVLELDVDLIEKFSTLTHVSSSGETLPASVSNRFLSLFPGTKLINLYGPTEISSDATYIEMHPMDENATPVGTPIDNATVYVLDQDMNLCPPGVTGEIHIGGDGLALGYLGRADLTRERFVENPFGEGRLYKSGDLGSFSADGVLHYHGRIDNQLKIRGFRIEPGEIEAVMRSHPSIKEALVITDGGGSEKRLFGYFVSDESDISDYVRTYLSERLPDYMVPSQLIGLASFPLTPNGKLDRKALPKEIGVSGIKRGPKNETEKAVMKIWSRILKIEQSSFGIDTGFFELGGHSLKAVAMVSAIFRELNIRIPLRIVFEKPTVRAISSYIEKKQEPLAEEAIVKAEERDWYPLSSGQKRIYVVNGMEPESTRYNVQRIFRIRGEIDPELLENALRRLVERHESLRTGYAIVDGMLLQHVESNFSFKLERREIVHQEKDEAIRSFIKPFDLSEPPLMRAALFTVDDDSSMLIIDIHHIATDGTSDRIILRELSALYRNEKLAPVAFQYRDFSQWWNGDGGKRALLEEESFWLTQYEKPYEQFDIPSDRPRKTVGTFNGNSFRFYITGDDAVAIENCAGEEKATPFMFLLSGLMILLSRLGGTEDVVVGVPSAGRNRPGTESIVGFFINTLAVRGLPAGRKTFRTFLREVRETSLAAFDNQSYPFEDLVEKVAPKRGGQRNPLFDVLFNYINMEDGNLELFGLDVTEYDRKQDETKFDINITSGKGRKGLWFKVVYGTDLFDEATVRRFMNYLKNLLLNLSRKMDAPIAAVEMLPPSERVFLLEKINGTGDLIPETTIHRFFSQVAKEKGTARAVILENKIVGYSRLEERSNRLANHLLTRGFEKDKFIVICMERSIDFVVSMLAVLKTGAAYVPVSPDFPSGRIDTILDDGKFSHVLTKKVYSELFKGRKLLLIDIEEEQIGKQSEDFPEIDVKPQDPSYVIYTSGSTGRPKGVVGTHQATMNRCFWMWRSYPFNENDRYLTRANLSFVGALWDLFGPLLAGIGTTVLSDEEMKDPYRIVEIIKSRKITRMHLVPSLMKTILNLDSYIPDDLSSLRICTSGAETLTPSLVGEFRKRVLGVRILNLYGSTETASDATCIEMSGRETENVVGKPISNVSLYLLDRHLNPVPKGVKGNIYIGGSGLALEYLGNIELTRKKFIRNPFGEGKIYDTGDIGVINESGNLVYIGRSDLQVKVRGYRVEPEEIEKVILSFPGMKSAAVIAKNEGEYGVKLHGFVVFEKRQGIGVVIPFLKKSLPDYMIPSTINEIDEIPLTPTGKIDREHLSKLKIERVTTEGYREPETPVQELLVNTYREILGLEKIGIGDNFFDLGGDSLMAIKVIDKLHKSGLVVTVAQMIQYHSIEDLAEVIKTHGAEGEEWSCLVELQKGRKERTPIFLFHSPPGDLLGYVNLIPHLDPDQPVYGFQSLGLHDRENAHESVEEMAGYYLEQILKFFPRGPYILGGWCFGGTIAFEVARQMGEVGEKVQVVLLIDTWPRFPHRESEGFRMKAIRWSVKRRFWKIKRLLKLAFTEPVNLFRYLNHRLRKGKRTSQEIFEQDNKLKDIGLFKNRSYVRKKNSIAQYNYQSRPYEGKIAVFVPEKHHPMRLMQIPSGLLWHIINPDPEIHNVPGTHEDIMKKPNVYILAKRMKEVLARTELEITIEEPVNEDVEVVIDEIT